MFDSLNLLGICIICGLLAGCMTVIGWGFEAVSPDLQSSPESFTLFYMPATNRFLLCVTIPYFVVLILVAISDVYALKIALSR